MTDPEAASQVRLPADRAFVVQFAAAQTGANPFRGRVEHLASGQVMHFESLSHLTEFVTRVIAAAIAED